jgi:phospholipid-binding lipoprotein MlaA
MPDALLRRIPAAFGKFRAHSAVLAAVLALSACAAGPAAEGVNDPLEPVNRAVHAVNKGLDTVLVRPAGGVYGTVPLPVRQGVSNLADTLGLPGEIANSLLQANVEEAGINTLRLATNLTAGLGGIFDAATALGLPEPSTDFGETLHVWGVGEGPYLELPGFGPSTLRDAVGTAVDLAFDPLGEVLKGDEARAATGVRLLSRVGDRARYSDTIDGLLYESADSYAQARLLYLQNRRFELQRGRAGSGGEEPAADDDFIDPYEDF